MRAKLTKSEQTYLDLSSVYESYGYERFSMRKFEEYSLYLENKYFLNSDHILTFNDPGGKLMALKPDITLSILKNAKNKEASQKVYYRENVCRLDKRSMQYREIEQLGLEVIDSPGGVTLSEICELAQKSLEAVDEDYILCISDMEYVLGVLDTISALDTDSREKLLSFIVSKNAHELKDKLVECKMDEGYANSFSLLVMQSAGKEETLDMAASLVKNARMEQALKNLRSIVQNIKNPEKIRIDFTLINNISYYNGPVFCGYVKRIPRAILSGGFYDKMARKFSKNCGAGFALSLDELNAYYEERPKYDVDTLILYDERINSVKETADLADRIRESGKSVRVEALFPKGLRCREVIDLRKSGK